MCWPNFGWLLRGDLLETPKFQPNSSAGAGRVSHTPVFSLMESRAGKTNLAISPERGATELLCADDCGCGGLLSAPHLSAPYLCLHPTCLHPTSVCTPPLSVPHLCLHPVSVCTFNMLVVQTWPGRSAPAPLLRALQTPPDGVWGFRRCSCPPVPSHRHGWSERGLSFCKRPREGGRDASREEGELSRTTDQAHDAGWHHTVR